MSTFNFPQQSPESDFGEGVIDIAMLWRSVYRHKWGIVALGFISAVIAAFYASTLTPIYQASTSLLIEKEQSSIVSIQELYAPNYRDWEYMQTQYELLRSRSLAGRVILELDLHKKNKKEKKTVKKKKWFNLASLKPAGFNPESEKPQLPPTKEELEQQKLVQLTGMVAGGIQISPVDDTNILIISFRSADPKLAAQVVNTLADQYIESHLEAKLGATQKATEWLNERLADLKLSLKKSELKLQSYREQQHLVDLEGIATLGAQEISGLNARYSEARQKRIAAGNIRREVARLEGASTNEYLTIPAILKNELTSELKKHETTAERKVSELAKRYGYKHPKMIAAQSELSSAREVLRSEVLKIITGIDREYQLAETSERSLRAQLNTSKHEFQEINRKEFQVQELQREVDTNRQLHDLFFTRIQETSQGGGFDKAHARIIDPALPPHTPISPNKKRIVTMALMLGLMGGAGIAVLLGFLDNTIKTPEDAQEKLGVPLLGALPLVKVDKNGQFEQFWQNHRSQYAESMRTIRTGVVLSGLDNPAKIIVVTSSFPGEGKSTVSLNLGAAFGHLEKTLVLGADLRKPSLAKKCQLPANHPGLSNYVAGTAELDDCISQFGEEEMYVMPAGIIPSNPLEMLSSQKFITAMETLKQRFSRIIIDSAPVQAVSDALILASYADSVIFVVKSDSTAYTVAKKSIYRLRDSNLPFTGVVLNHFDMAQASKYYGSKYYQYGEYYQTDDDKA